MEAYTIVGKRGGASIVTMVDMTSRFLLGGKATKKDSDSVKEVMLGVLNSLPSRIEKYQKIIDKNLIRLKGTWIYCPSSFSLRIGFN